jgi:hypothetical protein
MTKLSWNDLFLEDPQIDFVHILGCWPQVGGRVLPIGLSAFGDAFFARPDESVWRLDSFSGEIDKVASSQSEFATHMNSQDWQERYLRSPLVLELVERGLKRGKNQVFAPVPHPAQAGVILLERAQVLDAVVWHSISSQTLAQIGAATRAKSATKPWWRFW